MKKILLFLVLTSLNLAAQTPIYQYNFDSSLSDVNNTATFSYNGTLVFGADRFGVASKALRKTSVGQVFTANMSSLPTGNSPRTVSVWVQFVNITASTPNMGIFFYGTETSGNGFGLQQRYNSIASYSYGQDLISPLNERNGFVNSGGWYHYVMTYDGTTVKTYRNGKLIIEGNAASWNTLGTTFKLGTHNSNLASYDSYAFDDLKVYNVALSESQIQNVYIQESPLDTTDLVAFFSFDSTLNSHNNVHSFNNIPSVPVGGDYNAGYRNDGLTLTGGFMNQTLEPVINDDNFTIAFWQKRDVPIANSYETSIELFNSMYIRQRMQSTTPKDNFGLFFDATNTMYSEEFVAYAQDNWNHHALVYENVGGIRKLHYYINGDFIRTISLASGQTLERVTSDIYLGTGFDDSANSIPMNSKTAGITIDELYIFNKVLNQREIMGIKYHSPAALSNSNFELKEISLYPNPTNSMFTVEVPNDTVKTISVVDVMGKVVVTSNVSTVDVSNLASGIYIVKVETTLGKTGTQKLVKN